MKKQYNYCIDKALPYKPQWNVEQVESNRDLRQNLHKTLNHCDVIVLCKLATQKIQPTVDDAIAVVENIKHEMAKTYSIVCETEVQKAIAKTVDNVLEDVLTAMRGLKEGK